MYSYSGVSPTDIVGIIKLLSIRFSDLLARYSVLTHPLLPPPLVNHHNAVHTLIYPLQYPRDAYFPEFDAIGIHEYGVLLKIVRLRGYG